ncbi:MAG: type II secretion system protein GspG, partial [Phycisphaerae bacterium]|nr:type II secretion system protein GspG [Phycisphaerae bacterium]
KSLNDPWGGRYTIKVPGDSGMPFEIVSYGADKQPGGEGENADISSAQ